MYSETFYCNSFYLLCMCVFVYWCGCMCTWMCARVWKTTNELPLLFSKGPSLVWNSPHRQGWSKPKVPPASASTVLGYRCVHYTQLFFTWILGIELTELSHLVSAQKIFQKLIKSYIWSLKPAFSINIKYFVFLNRVFNIKDT